MSDRGDLLNSFQKSFLVSADMAHGVHPNYSTKHQRNHKVQINEGIVIKTNANQRYTTNSLSSSLAKSIAGNVDIPIQKFIVRADSRCGSTIGPSLSSRTGINSIDLGICQFAMHSVREVCGVKDCFYYSQFMQGVFKGEKYLE